tara:strand:+ start:464 stop:964 length:501 start_codon:yes stop_codon:yes gene_type:complete
MALFINMKKIFLILLLPSLVFSEEWSSDIAISYVKKDLSKLTSLDSECVGFYFGKSDDAKTYYSFELREIHNTKCGGDPDTAPRLASVMVFANKKINVFSLMCNSYVDINDYSWDMECPKKKYCIYPYNNPKWPNTKTSAIVSTDLSIKCPLKDNDGNDLIESYIE